MHIRRKLWGKQQAGFIESYQTGGMHNHSIFPTSCHAQEVSVEFSRNRIV